MKNLILLCATLMLATSQVNAAAEAEVDAKASKKPSAGRALVMRVQELSVQLEEEATKAKEGTSKSYPDFIESEDGVLPSIHSLLKSEGPSRNPLIKMAAQTLAAGLEEYIDAARGHLDEDGEAALTQLSEKLKALELDDEAEEVAADTEGAAAEGTTEAEADKE